MTSIIFLLMILVALFIIFNRNLKRVIIATGVFSSLAAFAYLMFHAPDVAIAEAVIGSGFSTILYIIALKKHNTFFVYITSNNHLNNTTLSFETRNILARVSNYCLSKELQIQCVYSQSSPEEITEEHICDLIIVKNEDNMILYGFETDMHANEIYKLISKRLPSTKFIPID